MAQDVNSPDFVIGVIGTGTMGRGIAQISVTGGFKVKMVKLGSPDQLIFDELPDYIQKIEEASEQSQQ